MYKFEIYRNTSKTNTTFGFSEVNRYDKDNYVLERAISPIWNDLSFQWKRENDRMFFRKTLKGSFMLEDSDFDWINGIRVSPYEIARNRFLRISEKIDGSWSVVYDGFFNVADGEFDLSRCVVRFSDILVFDEYSALIENIESEKNLLDLPPTTTIEYEANDYPYFEQVVTFEDTVFSVCNQSITPSAFKIEDAEKFIGIKWLLYEKTATFSQSGECVGSPPDISAVYHVKRTYRRDWVLAASQPVGDWEDSGLPVDENGNSTWVRYYNGIDAPTYKKTTSGGGNVVNPDCQGCEVLNYLFSLEDSTPSEIESDRGRLLSDVISNIISDTLPAIYPYANYGSIFLNEPTNPITEEVNTLNDVVVFQLSDMKPTSDKATRGMYSLKDVERFILPFNGYWYIDSNGKFRVEHRKFFDNGLTYGSASFNPSTDLDLSSEKINIVLNYSDDIPQKQVHVFAYSGSVDFIGLPIRFNGNVVNRNEDESIEEFNFGDIATDLTSVTSNPDNVGNDGFFIATTYTNEETGNLAVHFVEGDLSESDVWNGYMSVANLQERYWKWGGSMPEGVMNGKSAEFTQRNIIIISDIITSTCGTFNPYKLVRTSFGDGRVEEAEITLKDKKLTLTLSFSS